MEAMKGSVKDEINKKGCLSEMEAMNYFTQAAEGLVYLHSRKPKAIVHRDVKCIIFNLKIWPIMIVFNSGAVSLGDSSKIK